MASRQRLFNCGGGAPGGFSSRRRRLFGWESVANCFDATIMEVRKEIHTMEAKEFGGRMYPSDIEICNGNMKWMPNPRKLRKRRLYFLHFISTHKQMETLLNMVLCDKQVDNYKLFAGQGELKRVLRDIRYDMDDIVVTQSRVECYMGLRVSGCFFCF